MGKIGNINIKPDAAILYSKLQLQDKIINNDIKNNAAISGAKLQLQNSVTNNDINNGAYIVTNTVYDNKTYNFSSHDTWPVAFTFSPDGTKLYLSGYAGRNIYEFTLATPFDISNVTYNGKYYYGNEDHIVFGIEFSTDGTKMFLVGNHNDTVFQHSLSVPWDITTVTYDNKSFSVNTEDNAPLGLAFNSNGTKMYIMGRSQSKIHEYALSTPWDLDTVVYSNKYLSVINEDTNCVGLSFSSDGTQLMTTGENSITLYHYQLAVPWDIASASLKSQHLLTTSHLRSAFYGANGTKLFTLHGLDLSQYTIPLSTFDNIKAVGVQTRNLNMGNNKVENVRTPTDDSDAATMKYVDDKVDAELLDYDSNKNYQEGEAALFSNIEQAALVDVPANPIYYPENWLPINIHNSKLITENSLDFFAQEVSVDTIKSHYQLYNNE